jgi:transposase
VDALGNPVRLSLTAGQKHDITEAESALEHIRNANVIADKGYDSNALIEMLVEHGCVAVIPPRTCRAGARRAYDRHLYKERFLVEALFQKLKRNRRIAMRFEKLASHFLGMVSLAAALIWTL